MQFICHPIAMGIHGKIRGDARTGAAEGVAKRSAVVRATHPKERKE